MRPFVLYLVVLVAVAAGLLAPRARAVDSNFAGSVQLDYHFVPTQGGNLNHGEASGAYGFDGFTIEAAEKLAVDISNHLSANVKVCFGCHGFELDMAYMDYRVADEFNLRFGRFSPSFGSFNLRHDAANHKLSDKPLPYDMGRMLRLRTWNMGVLPSPFPDSGVEINGTHWFGDSTELDYALYAVAGFRSNEAAPSDLKFQQSRSSYYTDNNARPTVGARLAWTQKLGELSDMTFGASGMYGTYDSHNDFTYAILGGDLSLRIKRTSLRLEYLARRTEFDVSNVTRLALPEGPNPKNYVLKHGAYVELEQPLSETVDLILRVDGLYRAGNFLKSTEEDEEIPLRRRSYMVRYTLGGSFLLERGLRIKLSTEFWQFSVGDEDGKKRDLSAHVAFVGTY